ncbi:hypothetical protein [Sphingomonas sp. 10B4]|uniref:hypothetical protein n=1 Tax=Sphingomonas sp. 10B4 TaxID=3048575 RepID=UPI002AB58344|nr:hypothetical protein [Sphingomonas sp. 10B4]MDY7523258.1 hypothetical protein [Sphingomonas sp. 10B4]MEB0283506.1 hypothetical protein [Sphingomonas sp. 10B4]
MLGLAGKSLGWFLAGVAVALGFLLVPLQVAAERKRLDRTAADIVRAKRDIRALETEFDTRANLAQLDKWNAETLGLVAPAADQFVADESALASIEPTQRGTAPQMASFVPAAPAAVAMSQQPVIQPAVATAGAPAAPRAAAAAPAQRVAPVSGAVAAPVARTAMASVSRERPRAAVALLDRALLDDSVIGDLRSSARAEKRTSR